MNGTARALRLLLLLVLPGCEMESCAGNWPPPQPDASIPDAGHDAWMRTDVGRDGGRDVGIDADAPFGPTDPGWVHVAALPDECEIDVATYPERVVPVGTWAADCGLGCQHWGNTGNLIYVGESGAQPLIATIGETPEGASDPRRFVVVSDLETGRAVFALRDRVGARLASGAPRCRVTDQGVGSGALVASVNFYDYDDAGRFVENAWMAVLRHELGDAPTTLRSLVREADFELTSNGIIPSEEHVGMLFGYGVPSLVGNDGSHVVPSYGTGDTLTNTNLEMTGEAELFWEAWREPTVLVRSSNCAFHPS